MFGGEANTTNNRMELTAVIEAFKALNRDGQTVEVFSDSAYVSKLFPGKWYESWEKQAAQCRQKICRKIRTFGKNF